MNGKVYLIGAGPGDPGLFTLKGKAILERADCVVYDYLASEELLRFARADAEKIYVGKRGGAHSMSQAGINELLVRKAREGRVVARLKGGDPFVFGRGGEEAEELVKAGIPFEVVPGISSGYAAPAYAGIPLTHRDFTSGVAFLTGHEDPTKAETALDWSKLATGVGTLVFFMGVKNLPEITSALLQHGRRPETPVAVIRWGTRPDQQVVTGTLADITSKAAGIAPPAITVVGEVVSLRDQLNWFERLPLFGKRIVITRTREQASVLREALSRAGRIRGRNPDHRDPRACLLGATRPGHSAARRISLPARDIRQWGAQFPRSPAGLRARCARSERPANRRHRASHGGGVREDRRPGGFCAARLSGRGSAGSPQPSRAAGEVVSYPSRQGCPRPRPSGPQGTRRTR